MILMAIDPGISTGVAIKMPDGAYFTLTSNEPAGWWRLIADNNPEIVAYERFTRSNRVDPNMLRTIELVGSIIGICSVLDLRAYGQMPQERKSFIPDAQAILKRTIIDHKYTPHEVDALSHLLRLEWRIKNGEINA